MDEDPPAPRVPLGLPPAGLPFVSAVLSVLIFGAISLAPAARRDAGPLVPAGLVPEQASQMPKARKPAPQR